ncbi:MAG: autotransporter domain-containing protein [Proteobacteria bacterium]|jgi:outer membrane lipase/esterase|nr:autotransporter domain-containing protein [Pseudomonadota bacterium]
MPTLRPSIAALAASLALAAPAAHAQFSGAYIFGDSLSDAGQYGARFTTNPGLTVPMYVAQGFGFNVTPSFFGGTDYAQGGANVNSPSPSIPPSAPNLSIADQVSQLLAKGPLNRNALYQLWGGSNDIILAVSEAGAGAITPAQAQAAVVQAATDLVTQAVRLQSSGARYLIVYNVTDIGRTPAAAAAGAQASFTALSSLFDTTMNAGIAAAHLQVVQVNVFKLLDEVTSNPAAFGFVNATAPVCTTSSALQCTPATLRDPNGALTWVFADGLHPTTGLALIGAEAALSMLQGPAMVGALAEQPLAAERGTFRAIDGRMMSSLDAQPASGKINVWGGYDYGHHDIDGSALTGNADVNMLNVGGDVKVSDRMLVGGAFGYSDHKGDFGDGNGGFKLRETTGTAYAGYGGGPWYVGATLGAGDLDYRDVRRNITLGALTRTESGNTRGWHLMASVLGGYWFSYRDLLHGPYARLAYQKIHVDAYSEQGSDSTALSYGEQERTSLVSSLGWQVAGRLGNVRPFARVAWAHEGRNDDRSVSATPVGLAGTYSVPVLTPGNNWVDYTLGASADFGGVTGYVTGSATSGKSDGNGYVISVGVRVPM